MSYDPTTDFFGLLRQVTSGVEAARMPGLDCIIFALSRAGMFRTYVGQTPPTSNQATTVWLKPSQPSWVAEGSVFLWDADAEAYALATPALWIALLTPATNADATPYVFQSVSTGTGTVSPGVSLLAIQRTAPTATVLTLPSLAAQFATGRKLQIVDFSDSVTEHQIVIATPDGAGIMKNLTWTIYSNAVQLAGLMLQPSPDLNAWIIAP